MWFGCIKRLLTAFLANEPFIVMVACHHLCHFLPSVIELLSFFWLVFMACIFIPFFSFQTCYISILRFAFYFFCKQDAIGFYFYPPTICVLMGALSPFTLNVIADIFEFKPAILLSVFFLFALLVPCPSFFPLLPSFEPIVLYYFSSPC